MAQGDRLQTCWVAAGHLCATAPIAVAALCILLAPVEDFMKPQTIIVPLFAAAALASGCASTEARDGSNDFRNESVRSNEGYYAIIDSIEFGQTADEISKAKGRQDVYFIRVRFDDRSYQTVPQASLDGLRVGDSVRIEHNRVRRY
jgi:hypothetical protein